MDGAYTEHSVKRENNVGTLVKKAGLILLIVVFLALGLLVGATIYGRIAIIVGIGMIFVTGVLWPRFNVEYEYIYCDGQFDFDKIAGGDSRKHIARVDLDGINILAPENSHELDHYNTMTGLTVRDFSSGTPDAKRYCIFATEGDSKLKIIFEPSEKMLDMARQKSPRKVIL